MFLVTLTLLEPTTMTAATLERGLSPTKLNGCRIVFLLIQLRVKKSLCPSPAYWERPKLATNNPESNSNQLLATRTSLGSDSSSKASGLRMRRQPCLLWRNRLCSTKAVTETAGHMTSPSR